ncbi:hypothetical protein ACYVL9_003709 [Vibrio fluvialis]
MEIIRSREFKASRAWGAKEIANMNGITTRLHWTDQPYKWHINDGEEVFVVLDGVVEMLYRIDGQEKRQPCRPAIFSMRQWVLSMSLIHKVKQEF